MSGEARHDDAAQPRGGAARWAMMGGWVVALLLAANLAWGRLNEQDGRPQGFLSEGMLLRVALWGPVIAAVTVAAFGILWTQKSYSRREKASLLWTRHAFTFTAVGALLFTMAALDQRTFPRPWLAAAAAALFAAQTAFFGYASFREYRRTLGGGRSGHHSRREGDDDEDDR